MRENRTELRPFPKAFLTLRIADEMQTPAVAVCLLALLAGAEAFAPMPVSTGARLGLRAAASRRPARGLALKMVDVPRVALPEQVTTVLAEQELQNPNDLPAEEYNKYAAALIGAQWITALLGTQIFDVSGFAFDFVFAALIGGGAAAFLSLYKDTSEYGMKVGEVLMQAAEKVDVKEIPKITVPEQVTAPLADAGLMNPNELSTEDYNKYAAATIGTTFVFLLLGSQIFDISGLLFDGAFASLGGGAAAYAALGKTEAKEYVNKFGEAILSAVDSAAEKIPK